MRILVKWILRKYGYPPDLQDGVIARFVRKITLRARNTSIPTSTHRLSDSVSRCPANTELFDGSSG